jgi:hypothetical protein
MQSKITLLAFRLCEIAPDVFRVSDVLEADDLPPGVSVIDTTGPLRDGLLDDVQTVFAAGSFPMNGSV